MLKRNMVHFIGSDSHNLRNRNFCLTEAINHIRGIIGPNICTTIEQNPYKIISGEKINPPDTIEIDENTFFSKLYNYLKYK
jgi:tyrosine-protein phosphatase YwqE